MCSHFMCKWNKGITHPTRPFPNKDKGYNKQNYCEYHFRISFEIILVSTINIIDATINHTQSSHPNGTTLNNVFNGVYNTTNCNPNEIPTAPSKSLLDTILKLYSLLINCNRTTSNTTSAVNAIVCALIKGALR